MKDTIEKKLISVSEAVQMLGISDTTIRKLIKSGEIPSKQIGNRMMILKDKLEEWLNN